MTEAGWVAVRGNLATLAEAADWQAVIAGPVAAVAEPEDREFLVLAADRLAGLAAIQDLAQGAQGLQGARIRLASFPSVFARLLPPLLRDFRRRHPGIDLVALEGSDEEVEAWLAAGIVDLGVVLNPAPGRAALALGRDAWVALAPSGHALAGTVALAELAAQPFVLATGGCHVNAHSLAAAAGLELADVRVTVRDWASAFALVREGMGVALVPESTLPDDCRGVRVLALAAPV